MHSTSFMLLPGRERDIIVLPGTDIMVHVYNLSQEIFMASPDELQLWADNAGDVLVFQSEGWNPGQLRLITAAIQWYAASIGQPDMDIAIDAPATIAKFDLNKELRSQLRLV